jgi:subfamily B ATP-binding cassette protein HlyB/CyaB
MEREELVSENDTGLICLLLILQYHGKPVDLDAIRHSYGPAAKGPGEQSKFGDQQIIRALKSFDFRAKSTVLNRMDIDRAIMPAICKNSSGGYFLLVGPVGVSGRPIAFVGDARDPEAAEPLYKIQLVGESSKTLADGVKTLTAAELERMWDGRAIVLSPRKSRTAAVMKEFNIGWFLESFVKYRSSFSSVIKASFLIPLFALVTPLFFQVVMDKVLVHSAVDTLNVLAIGLVASMVTEVLLTALRNYIFSHTTTGVDVQLGARLFCHLIHLPMAWFQKTQAGQTVARVKELDSLRNFITSTALTIVIDLVFTVVYIVMMLTYSIALTAVVLLSLPLYVALSLSVMPVLKKRLDRKFLCGAELQSLLVEVVGGIETVKSMALEPQLMNRWEAVLAAFVSASFRAQNLGQNAGQAANLIQKLTTAVIIWLGANMVMDGDITVGQLVAFNMIAGRISGPILKLAQLWQEFQQASISLKRLGDILNTPPEPGYLAGQGTVPKLRGAIRLENVCFRYTPDAPKAADGLTIEIRPGEIVGVAGTSGCGKSTLVKLILGLFTADSGRILLDGHDLSGLDKSQLRRQIGVVPQESVLFSGTVRDNIAISDPGVPLTKVIGAAKAAGAHDFIMQMPDGYDTLVGERGASMSGGQRQRLAIARVLIRNPQVLIFDEATSSLDYESEMAIQRNMKDICSGRTVIIIAHRLTALKGSDTIVMLEKGRIEESGPPMKLLEQKGAFYRMAVAQGLIAASRKKDASGGSV